MGQPTFPEQIEVRSEGDFAPVLLAGLHRNEGWRRPVWVSAPPCRSPGHTSGLRANPSGLHTSHQTSVLCNPSLLNCSCGGRLKTRHFPLALTRRATAENPWISFERPNFSCGNGFRPTPAQPQVSSITYLPVPRS
ncbi:hypothetical protein CSOJ01_01947 [Colletotrichum sojae]|uniref:Uncharacterized protein n=1 Tax=Colletotrichum sojae TaxID=2175907 RepID=A0A8H6JT83_9PEZI|nr:hypothetical protein CSOJ01_01947 [Colletotrichum sojae]